MTSHSLVRLAMPLLLLVACVTPESAPEQGFPEGLDTSSIAPQSAPASPVTELEVSPTTAPSGGDVRMPSASPSVSSGGPTADPAPPVPAPGPTAVTSPTSVPAGPAPLDPDGPLGAACRPLLQPAIPGLVIEVDSQAGAALPGGVVDHLAATTAAVADKPAGVAVDTAGTVPGDQQEWTVADIRAAAAATRDHAQTADQAVVHVLSLRGVPDQDDPAISGAIGIAFSATELAVFPDRVDGLAVLLGGDEAVLRAVVVHELGHLLCLVNIDNTSEQGREDPDHPGHSANRDSVMFHAIETTAIGQVFAGPPPDTFDAADLADLEALRTGRY